MPRFAANLTMLFTEYPFLERFDRAAAAGFQAVEFLFPYDHDVPAIAAALRRNRLEQVNFNLPAGDFAGGERGIANDPHRVDAFRDGVERAIAIAGELGCLRLNCLVGLALPEVPIALQWDVLTDNLRFAAERTAEAGITLLVEPLNNLDTPGYLLVHTDQALELLDRAGNPNLKLQYDCYHMQRMEGNLTATLVEHLPRIGHIQIAACPGRHQPGSGEINYPFIFEALDAAGYDGWVSLEYNPVPNTEASLAWLRDWGYWT